MMVHRCDNCQKVMQKDELVIVGRDIFRAKAELCPKCAEPVLTALAKSKINPKIKEKLKVLPNLSS